MRDIRAVVTDLDGTIVDARGHVSPATVRAAADLSERGVPLIVATARTPSWVATLAPLLSSVRVAICCGGAVGWSPASAEMLWRDTLPPEAVDRTIRSISQCLPDAGIAVYDAWQWRVTESYARLGPKRPGPTQVVAVERLAAHPICVLSICHPGGRPDGLLRQLTDRQALTVESSTDVTDVAANGSDKARGLARALAAVGVHPTHAIAFGDAPMDLPLFEMCRYGVAVGNAHPDVIAAATDHAASVDDDGFARTLGELGLARAYPSHAAGGSFSGETGGLPSATH